MVTIKVISERSGKPEKGKDVSLGIDGFLSGGVTKRISTDTNGEAHFDINPCSGKIWINGSEKFKGKISGRVLIYI